MCASPKHRETSATLAMLKSTESCARTPGTSERARRVCNSHHMQVAHALRQLFDLDGTCEGAAVAAMSFATVASVADVQTFPLPRALFQRRSFQTHLNAMRILQALFWFKVGLLK